MTALRLKLFVSDDLAAALAPSGRVLSLQDQTFKGYPTIDNGTRSMKMEMKEPVPNFIFMRVPMGEAGVLPVRTTRPQPGRMPSLLV